MKAKMVLGVLGGLLLAGGAIAVVIAGPPFKARVMVASGYGARVVCSCHFVGKRSLESCKTDFEPGMELLQVRIDREARQVTAGVPLVGSRAARYEPGFGCTLIEP